MQTKIMLGAMNMIRTAFLAFAGHMIKIVDPTFPCHLVPEPVRVAINIRNKARQDPIMHLITLQWDQRWMRRCRGPGCLQTETPVGRRFKRCGTCKITPYCSRACQQAAWKHLNSSHRLVCSIFWLVCVAHNCTNTKELQLDAVYNGLVRMIGPGQAQSGINHLDYMHESQFKSMCTFYV
jgi:hypothetical protein